MDKNASNRLTKISTTTSWNRLLLGILISLLVSTHAPARETGPDYDELLVFFQVEMVGNSEMPAVIKEDNIYLSIVDVFTFLGIKSYVDNDLERVSGFIHGIEDKYSIERLKGTILYNKKKFSLSPEVLIKTETGLYLKSDYFGKVFGLECKFNFRQLAVTLKSKRELPIVRSARQAKIRSNINQLKQEITSDTIIGRKNTLFNLGVIDWSVNSRQEINGNRNTWFNLGVNGILAGGELKGLINYSKSIPFKERNQHYLWRYVNNDHKVFRQIKVGKVKTQSISSIFNPVIGIQITNTPTSRKASFGTYSYYDTTQPGWLVELYINNILVDYTEADKTGFFTFDIPLIYGTSDIMLRYFGPWGEEYTLKKTFNIPYTFLSPNELEYTLSSGMVEDGTSSLFSQARINYGLSRNITIGGGVEYLSSMSKSTYIPFLNSSIQITPHLLLNGEYIYGVRSKGKLTYARPSRLRLELTHTQYEQGQKAVLNNYSIETQATVGAPFRFLSVPFFSRISVSRNQLNGLEFNNAKFELTGSGNGASMGLNTTVRDVSEGKPVIFSDLTASFILPAKFILHTKTRYLHENEAFSFSQVGLKRNLFGKGFIKATYEHQFQSKLDFFRVGLVYNFSFASFGVSSTHSKNGIHLFESASGSLVHEPRTNFLSMQRRKSTGTGGVIIVPFLDLNCNGKRDAYEATVSGLHVRGKGGHIDHDERSNSTVISGLEAYSSYFVELDGNDFENISWRLDKSSLSIMIEPGQFKVVEIPVIVEGEASGTTYLQEPGGQKGMGRIKVCIYDEQSRLVSCTFSESDGYFSYMGLPAGHYMAMIDSAQLKNLNMSCRPGQQSFTIKSIEEGDYIDHLKFVLRKNTETKNTESKITKNTNQLYVLKDLSLRTNTLRTNRKQENETNPYSSLQEYPNGEDLIFTVQILATSQLIRPTHQVFKGLDEIGMYYHKNMYKYTWGEAKTMEYARILKNELIGMGFNEAFIVPFYENKRVRFDDRRIAARGPAKGLFFRVRIIESDHQLSLTQLNVTCPHPVDVYNDSGLYNYFCGETTSYSEAVKTREVLKEYGFHVAEIIPFYQK